MLGPNDCVNCLGSDPVGGASSGYPGNKSQEGVEPAGPAHVRSRYLTHTASPNETNRPIGAAVALVRDRTGFRYERHVGLDDFVTVRDAAQLLGMPAMTVTRWIKKRRIRSRKQNGFSVIRLREVLRVAQDRPYPVTIGSRLKIRS